MNKLALLPVLLCTDLFAQQVYLSIDKNGVPLYSDQPSVGAKKLQLNLSAQNLPLHSDIQSITTEPQPKAAPAYHLVIQKPAMAETVFSNPGEVAVHYQVEPEPARGHQLVLRIDNTKKIISEPNTELVLSSLDRGEHQLQLSVLDQNGKLLAESLVITFYLRKTTIASPK